MVLKERPGLVTTGSTVGGGSIVDFTGVGIGGTWISEKDFFRRRKNEAFLVITEGGDSIGWHCGGLMEAGAGAGTGTGTDVGEGVGAGTGTGAGGGAVVIALE